MTKILFVCTGNICRSPMAEYCFRAFAEEAGAGDAFFVASAGTSAEEIWNGIGNPVYPPAAEKLRERGISCEGKRAQVVTRADYRDYDLLITMEGRHTKSLHRLFGGDPDGKIRRLLSYTERERDIADPWYTGDFDTAFAEIEEGCRALLSSLTGTDGV